MNFSTLPLPMAWEAFGPKNVSASFKEFDQRIRGYATGTGSTLDIGCNVLVQPFFFERKDWIALPNWPKSVHTFVGTPALLGGDPAVIARNAGSRGGDPAVV